MLTRNGRANDDQLLVLEIRRATKVTGVQNLSSKVILTITFESDAE